MRIAFDLRWIRSDQIDGVSRYAINLISHLIQADTTNRYVLIGNQTILEKHLALSEFPNITVVSIPQALLSIQDFLLTPREIQRLNVDILHVPNYLTSPFKGNYKKILTVYDLIPFLFPEALSQSRLLWRLFYKTPYPAAFIFRSADTIIATSEHTKHDIIRLLNIFPEKIQVVWCGLENRFKPGYQVSEQFLQQHKLPCCFMLYLGRQDPYKGLTYLVQAYSLLPTSLRQTYKLVIAGKTDLRYIGEVHNLVETLHLRQEVIFLDYVPDADLPFLYSAATLLVHPSLYEGFGLPPLEAMACGTPVVYAETSSLTELIGDAGFAVPPASAESLASGIQKMLENDQLRHAFSAKGIQHTQRYTWQNAARKILEIYEGFRCGAASCWKNDSDENRITPNTH
jgi:glycosyltransferase involved in cell wall biosynthesis